MLSPSAGAGKQCLLTHDFHLLTNITEDFTESVNISGKEHRFSIECGQPYLWALQNSPCFPVSPRQSGFLHLPVCPIRYNPAPYRIGFLRSIKLLRKTTMYRGTTRSLTIGPFVTSSSKPSPIGADLTFSRRSTKNFSYTLSCT